MALKVFGMNLDGRNRVIVAAKSAKDAATLFGVSVYQLRNYGGETWNAEEVELAMREPGAVWAHAYKLDAEWVRK